MVLPEQLRLEKPSQFYDFPACLSAQLYIRSMESSGVFYKGEDSLKAPTHTLFIGHLAPA
eukprot:7108176-Prorocentrum_lima.AAC.1